MSDNVANTAPQTDDEKILEIARERYKRAMEIEGPNRDHALKCLKFRNLEQWEPEVKRHREQDPEGARPCLVVDKTNQYLRQVVNDERQNRPAIRVRPMDEKGDEEVAEILQGITRHIEDASNAQVAYDTAYEAAVDGGFGYWRIVTEYLDETSFDQDIRIKRVRNRFTVLMDPDRQEPDGSDAKWAFVIERMNRKDYEAQFPEADKLDFATDGRVFSYWIFKDDVIIAEYFYVEEKDAKLLRWANGDTSFEGDPMPKSVMKGEKPADSRPSKKRSVKWMKINAKEVLERRDWIGKWIPIVEVIGNELDIEGERITSGILKGAMEAQKIHNYAMSTFVESVALAPRAPWTAAEEQIEDNIELWRTANRRNVSVLTYKPIVLDGSVPVPPPQRQPMPGIPVGWQQMMLNTEHDIEASMGMYKASLGAPSNEKSGKAILAREKQGDTATFHYMDNLATSIRHTGRILLDLAPKYYDTARVARIVGEDGETDQVQLDPNQQEAVRKEVNEFNQAVKKIYNINVGRYDCAVVTGPAFSSRRQEAAETMVQIVQAQPALLGVIGDIMFRNMDFPGAEQIADRLKAQLPPQIAQADEEDAPPLVPTPQGPVPIPQAAQMIGQLMQQMQGMGEQLKENGDIEKHRAVLRDEATELEGQRAAIKGDLERIAAASRELALKEENAALSLKLDVFTAQQTLDKQATTTAPSEPAPPPAGGQAEAAQPLVHVIDSTVAGPLGDVARSVMAVTEAMARQTDLIAHMAQLSAAPRAIEYDENGRPLRSHVVLPQEQPLQ